MGHEYSIRNYSMWIPKKATLRQRDKRKEKFGRLKTEGIADFRLSINARLNENVSLQA
jgi:hypothetical protein